MDADAVKVALNLEINDGDNFSFSDAEKTRLITKAFNDPYVVEQDRDTSLTYSINTSRYALPANTHSIIDLYVDANGDNFEAPIARDAWVEVDGFLQINEKYRYALSDGKTIIIHRWKKLVDTDTISDNFLQDYVVSLATFFATRLLMQKRGNRFLKNDTTMGEVAAMRNEAKDFVTEYRRKLARRWQEV